MQDNSHAFCNGCVSQFILSDCLHRRDTCGYPSHGNCATTNWCDKFQTEGDHVYSCRFCFIKIVDCVKINTRRQTSPSITPSSSSQSLSSISSTSTSSSGQIFNPSGFGAEVQKSGNVNMDTELEQKQVIRPSLVRQGNRLISPKGSEGSPSPYDFCNGNRSDEEDYEYPNEGDISRKYKDKESNGCLPGVVQGDEVIIDTHDCKKGVVGIRPLTPKSGLSTEGYEGAEEGTNDNNFYATLCKEPSSLQEGESPLDVENNALLWIAPPPEDDEDPLAISDGDDDNDERNDTADSESVWNLSESLRSLNSYGYRSKDKLTTEEQRKAMRAVVDGHFRVLVSQLLNGEGLHADEGGHESWLEIVTSLSLQAANVVKPDTIGGMDPGGYVKVKCITSGQPTESRVVKGIVCKRNVAHRRMPTQLKNARILILGFALEFQMALSSMETLLQMETDHLSMAVSRIEAYNPNVLLVEKSVSRPALERLLAKGISLVLNVKRPLLERIARCTDATIICNIEQLTSSKSAKVGHCEHFHVEKYTEYHGRADPGGKRLPKTLMFFEDCPRPLGCSILLMGSSSDELKKVKNAVQFAVFAAYHLSLETSFLVDEGVNLPELRLKSPLTVALPDKKSKSDMSISTVSEVFTPNQSRTEHQTQAHTLSLGSTPIAPLLNLTTSLGDLMDPLPGSSVHISGYSLSSASSRGNSPLRSPLQRHEIANASSNSGFEEVLGTTLGKFSSIMALESFGKGSLGISATIREEPFVASCTSKEVVAEIPAYNETLKCINLSIESMHVNPGSHAQIPSNPVESQRDSHLEFCLSQSSTQEDEIPNVNCEDFPPSPSNHQSILVSFSSSCLKKGTICERGHLYRIKYYGTFDKPLGKFLRDTIFDTSHKCHSCGELKNAHVDCYTHRQGSLTISIHKQTQPLPGQDEGKIWMWHRCLKCTRINGIPPATGRVVMSDAAWGLSFGKFLELSFSNHAAASRVASCGHSLHRDCLRFYGFGNMVACLRYSPVNVYSVYLPPSKVVFCYSECQDWLNQEIKEICVKGNQFFKDTFNRLTQIQEKTISTGKVSDITKHKAELENILSRHKENFQTALYSTVLCKGPDQPHVDILHLNYIRQSLMNCSSVWDSFLQALLASFKSKYPAAFDSPLSGYTLSSLKDFSFGSGQNCIFDVKRDGYGTLNTKSGSPKGVLLKALDASSSESLKRQCYDVVEDAGGSFVASVSSTNSGFENGLCSTSSLAQPSANELNSKPGVTTSVADLQFTSFRDVSATFDAAWIGKGQSSKALSSSEALFDSPSRSNSSTEGCIRLVSASSDECISGKTGDKLSPNTLTSPSKEEPSNIEGWVGAPYSSFSRPLNDSTTLNSPLKPTIDLLSVSSFANPCSKISHYLVSIYDDEPTSIIAYAINSPEHQSHLFDKTEKLKDNEHRQKDNERTVLDNDSIRQPVDGSNEHFTAKYVTALNSNDVVLDDPMLYSKAMHVKVNFTDETSQGKSKYTVTCYYAKQFDGLRKRCCPREDFIRSLCRCKRWGAQGGKSNVFFAKTTDDRFVVKQVTKTELDSFISFAPAYFKYISDALMTGSPTCLAKILGIYQVVVKHAKGGKETRMDLMIMENLLYGRQVTRVYDLKGSLRSRYNADAKGKNSVLLDQNLLESIQTNPIFIGNKAKRLLERAVWNDTAFLASVDVMDYSLLVGIDEEKRDLVVGIIDFMRQYTWDKHLETWVKASGILGGPKNASPTVISPKEYKKRFRKAMSSYFLMVPDQWSSLTVDVSGLPRNESIDRSLSLLAINDGSLDSEASVKVRNTSI